MMRLVAGRAIVTSGITVVLAVLAVVSASIATASTSCRAPLSHPFPSVSALRVSHTGCATARSVVEYIQGVWQTTNGTLPGWFRVPAHGPWWHCRYQVHGQVTRQYHTASCASGRKLVTMRLNA
jgi:hypothetical protein